MPTTDPFKKREKARRKHESLKRRRPDKLRELAKKRLARSFAKHREMPHLKETYGDTPTLVYVLRVGRFVKVGITVNLRRRLVQVETGTPFEIEVMYKSSLIPRFQARKIETLAHTAFIAFRVRGEWFEVDHKRVVDFLTNLSPQEYIDTTEDRQLKLV